MRIKHPTIEGVERDIPDSQAESWIEQGWETAGASPVAPADPQAPQTIRPGNGTTTPKEG